MLPLPRLYSLDRRRTSLNIHNWWRDTVMLSCVL